MIRLTNLKLLKVTRNKILRKLKIFLILRVDPNYFSLLLGFEINNIAERKAI